MSKLNKRNSKLNKGTAKLKEVKINSVTYRNFIRAIMKPQYDLIPVVHKLTVEKTKNGGMAVTNMVTDEETGNIDFTITNTYDGPTDSEIVPPKTGILPTKDYTFFELLMNLILLSYSLVYLKKVEN